MSGVDGVALMDVMTTQGRAHYMLLKKIGAGGMAEVFLAQNEGSSVARHDTARG